MRLHNSIAVDGSVFVSRGQRVIWAVYLPGWAVRVYCTLSAWKGAR